MSTYAAFAVYPTRYAAIAEYTSGTHQIKHWKAGNVTSKPLLKKVTVK